MEINALTRDSIQNLKHEVYEIYRSDDIPWVIGYSGGKDSTAALQLVWNALLEHGVTATDKPVHIITVDTLVESPVISTWVDHSLKMMDQAAKNKLPIHIHKLLPNISETFWVNLLGRGYPFPKMSFRWCTDRLKIKPTNKFIQDMIARHGEVIMVLGTRKAESANRQQTLTKFSQKRTREHLNHSSTMQNEYIYPVIENWSNDNVWQYLMLEKNPWGNSNKELLTIYKGATEGHECPIHQDTNAPSCGNSRFGCWVCTVVEKDKSMDAMITEDSKKWMTPLANLRNSIADMSKENERRDFRRMDGNLLLLPRKNGLVHGPYKKEIREQWLKRLLEIQEEIRRDDDCPVENFTVILDDELREIRKIWLTEKHEFDDSLPKIYEQATGRPYPYVDSDAQVFGADEWEMLRQISAELYPDEQLVFELQAALLDTEVHASNMRYRHGILNALERQIHRCYYKNEEDALSTALQLKDDAAAEAEGGKRETADVRVSAADEDTLEQLTMEGIGNAV